MRYKSDGESDMEPQGKRRGGMLKVVYKTKIGKRMPTEKESPAEDMMESPAMESMKGYSHGGMTHEHMHTKGFHGHKPIPTKEKHGHKPMHKMSKEHA